MNNQIEAAATGPARTRTAILEAALGEFAEKGFGGSRIDTIAQRAGVNKQALYYHFGNKEDLFAATLEYGYGKIRESETGQMTFTSDPRENMARIILAFFDAMNANRHAGALIVEENRLGGRHMLRSRQARALTAPFVDRVAKVYQDGVAQGVFRPGLDPKDLWISLISVVQLYFTNLHSLSHILDRDLDDPAVLRARRAHDVDFILAAISA